MAKKDPRSPEQKIKALEEEVAEKEREILKIRQELDKVNRQLEGFIGQIGTQLHVALQIQKSLVPTEVPTIPGFEFSSKFVPSSVSGGDYFDIFELEDKMKFGVLMASSTSYGMASLFMSVLIKLTTKLEARRGMDPSDVLKHLLKELTQSFQTPNDAVHIFYGVVDRRDLSLSYAAAGDGIGYVYKFSQDKLVVLSTKEPALNINSKPNFKTESISLDPRDRFVMASRGLRKLNNSAKAEYGSKEICDVILENYQSTIHQLRNEILFRAKKFVKSDEYPADVSVVVMKIKDRVLKLTQESK